VTRRLLAALALLAAGRLGAQDPVTADVAVRDTVYPAALEEVAIPSGGARMNGLLLLAQGAGPHPLVVLLHGYPGAERNLDVAQALRRAGTHVLYFTYRGAWGSGGTFSFANAQADVAAALRWARGAEVARRFRLDARRVALIGHSMGGWLAMLGASSDPGVTCVGGIEFADMVVGMGAAREADSAFAEYTRWLTAPGGPLRADPRALVASLRAHPEWELARHAPRLAARPVLLLDADFNPFHDEMVEALRVSGARRLTEMTWPTDHSFNDRRVELARAVVGWVREGCGFGRR
jgi:pimeloyl-ACP methyl ester carboxylesterase